MDHTVNIEHVLIVRYGEVALKGRNKPYFEKKLLARIGDVLPEGTSARADGGLLLVTGYDPAREDALARAILRIFGVSTVSRAWRLRSREMKDICAAAVGWLDPRIQQERVSFKVFGKRADKTYPVTSPDLAAAVGEAILEAFGEDRVRVDVNRPDIRLTVHLRRNDVLIFDDAEKGFGGLPPGTNGKGLVLLSGGIDSPVAAWLLAKRGMRIEAVHFHSYPYTSKRAEEKVKELAEILAEYTQSLRVHILNLLPAQEALAAACPESEMTILVRRMMMRAAELIARREGCAFLITGENLGQVASQTAEALAVTDASSGLPVLRPLIALDKVEIIERAQEIGTYEKSIEPYEDCCTVFLPRHPVTKPRIEAILASEAKLGGAEVIDKILAEVFATEEVFEAG
ncbi:MAG: tRNA 4-thiouridine(8) synthase ThiI [Clostridiales Family XIII bacterium]|nr:tRNA 4-thiouridine(8) synthase ThiI [Clostridiales Family XIII bacterium]